MSEQRKRHADSAGSDEQLLWAGIPLRRAVLVWSIAACVTALLWGVRGRELLSCILGGAAFGWCILNAYIDARTMTLLPLWSNAAGALWLIYMGILTAQGQLPAALGSAAWAGGTGLCMGGLSLCGSQGLGRGDVRLIVVLSAWVMAVAADAGDLASPIYMASFVGCACILQLLGFTLWAVARRLCSTELSCGKEELAFGKQANAQRLRVLPFGPALVCAAWMMCIII